MSFHITDIINRKKRGIPLSKEMIRYFVEDYVAGRIPDYQMSALLMAIWFKDMTKEETSELTLAMMESGDIIDLSKIPGIKVDKHSTGGVADTTTLITAPLAAACGVKVAKMSGRGLGHTGGTIDKLESIPGFCVQLTMEQFISQVSKTGLSVIGQSANLVPADKKLYALRDVTGTVDSIPLIASSIMSKKLASGSDAIVLDVKTGSGAFMTDPGQAMLLAKEMVQIGKSCGKECMALVTDMNQPLGNAIGNAIEVIEAIEILQGKHEGDLKTVSIELARQMVLLAGICTSEEKALAAVTEALDSGAALEKLGQMIEAQGGDKKVISDTTLFPAAGQIIEVKAEEAGIITAMDTRGIGECAQLLGAGRQTKEDIIDPAVGIWMKKRIGDKVEKNEVAALFHVNDSSNLEEARTRFLKAITLGTAAPANTSLIYSTVKL